MGTCVGFDGQANWLSPKPLKPINMGFIYCVHNNKLDKYYIGSKQYRFYLEGGGTRSSDWETYYGSSKDLLADIGNMGVKHFDRYVISEHMTRNELLYTEANLQHSLGVLTHKVNDEYLYYNKFIDKCFREDV